MRGWEHTGLEEKTERYGDYKHIAVRMGRKEEWSVSGV